MTKIVFDFDEIKKFIADRQDMDYGYLKRFRLNDDGEIERKMEGFGFRLLREDQRKWKGENIKGEIVSE